MFRLEISLEELRNLRLLLINNNNKELDYLLSRVIDKLLVVDKEYKEKIIKELL